MVLQEDARVSPQAAEGGHGVILMDWYFMCVGNRVFIEWEELPEDGDGEA